MMDEESKQYMAFTVGNLGFFGSFGNEPMQSCSVCHVVLSVSLASALASSVYSSPSDSFDHRNYILQIYVATTPSICT